MENDGEEEEEVPSSVETSPVKRSARLAGKQKRHDTDKTDSDASADVEEEGSGDEEVEVVSDGKTSAGSPASVTGAAALMMFAESVEYD